MFKWWNEKRDPLLSAMVFALAFALYWRTLAPSVLGPFDDALEIQYVIPRLGILHPTGYPLYTILGKLFTLIVPLNDPAFRLNLFSALCAALAVAFVYASARKLVAWRAAALLAALIFAVGDAFWAQAVAAEVYALQMLLVALILWLTLQNAKCKTQNALYALSFAMGLGLAHHRLIVLLLPAIALYVFLVNRAVLQDRTSLARALGFLLLPFAFYLYLPLRGAIGSADGTYQNSLATFAAWISGSQYLAFVTANPLAVVHDVAFYQTLFQKQFTWAGIALAAIGVIGLARRPREWLLIVSALALQLAFVFNYRTADVQVHFLTAFLLGALLIAAGIDTLFSIADFRFSIFRHPSVVRLGLTLCLLAIPYHLLQSNYAANDLSQKWDVHDYGVDLLTQPFENNPTVIGILGEMTLMRYFQAAHGLRADVQTIAADKENARLAAIEHALKQNRAIYLTRALKGAPEKYSLSSVGPLIRVQTKPTTSAPALPRSLDVDFGAVKLIGYDLKTPFNTVPRSQHTENGKWLRVTLYWRVEAKMANDALVSLKILRADQRVFGQADHRPVRDAYPTNAWRVGEIIADTYDVPILFGATPGEYTINVTLYDAQSNQVLGQADLQTIALEADTRAPRRDTWQIGNIVEADFNALALVGYARDPRARLRPGDALPLTWLWRAGWQKPPANLTTRLWLEDDQGKQVASRDALISTAYPPFQWQPNMYVRDWSAIHLPANLADGRYTMKLAVTRDNELLGSTLMPFFPTVVDLGKIEIKNRARVMSAPAIARPLDAVFDKKIKLLGYDVKLDASQQIAHVTVYWRALAQMNTSYTVFVHLLDAQNKMLAAGDAVPGNGDLPTTGWIEDEYITDAHTLALENVPPGMYSIEIGVYDPVTGARLKTSEGADRLLLSPLRVP
ncbi:MAG: DUF2723 domain-containing protein [Chloroflexi bacterium]|nr:DUF2723 domain-containing protein [Chloroflexota bacterium]